MTWQPTRPNRMELDLTALDTNLALVRAKLEPGVRVHASVKSAAYGFDLPEVARRLVSLGAEALSCGSFEDARTLRQSGLEDTEIVMFGGTLPEGIPAYLDLNLIPTVHNIELAETVARHARTPAKIYIKVDAGWGRLGFPLKAAKESILAIARMPKIAIEGIYTHLPFTDPEGLKWAQERTTRFDELIDDLRRGGLTVPVTQARSSSGVLLGIKDNCNSVAPGSILYGKPSLPDGFGDFSGFKPVLRAVRSNLIHVNLAAADRTPGLHGRYAFKVEGATGVLPFGRRDGNRAALPGEASFMIVKGAKAPILAVSSEHTVLDLSEVPDPKVGDEVLIIGADNGHEVTLADRARWQNTGMNDILLMLSGRMPRVIQR